MREILFRGKTIKDGKWVYGVPMQHVFGDFQILSGRVGAMCIDTVVSETIGQYTGLHDMDGNKIFEGDIVNRTDLHISDEPSIGFIEYDTDNTAFLIHWIDIEEYSATFPWKEIIEVIGNIHDNSELLEENRK